jgi:hypothetical protein
MSQPVTMGWLNEDFGGIVLRGGVWLGEWARKGVKFGFGGGFGVPTLPKA